ncbi:MAG: hypothetical protein OIF55_14605 [Amphritea sp.]|nr:hypothetical protein [Amphritea sp.]
MKELLVEAVEVMKPYIAYGLPGVMGGAASYLFQHSSKGKPLSWTGLCIFAVLGFFTVNMIGPNVPDIPGRDGILWLLGFMFYPILTAIDNRGEAVVSWVLRLFPGAK